MIASCRSEEIENDFQSDFPFICVAHSKHLKSSDCLQKIGTLVDSMATVNVFNPTQEECDKIQSGTVDTIPRELKLRILNEIPEIVRIRVDLRQCVALLRGDRYVGSQQAKGQDFQFNHHPAGDPTLAFRNCKFVRSDVWIHDTSIWTSCSFSRPFNWAS